MGSTSTAALLAATIATVLLGAAVIGWGTRRADRPETVALWARARGVRLTSTNHALIRWYVLLAGTLRVVGAVSGAVVGSLADRALGVDTSAGPGFWAWVVVGWVSGGWWAAEQVARALPPNHGAALLVERRSEDYAPAPVRWAPVVGGAVLLLTAAVTAALGGSSRWAALAAALAVAVPLAARRLTRRVVDRRQPAAEPTVIAADDAIRSATVHLLGAGTAAALLLASAALWIEAVDALERLPYGLRGWLPVVFVVGGYATSTYLANRPWMVRRSPMPGGAA